MGSMHIENQAQVPIDTNHSEPGSSLFPSELQGDVESYTNPTETGVGVNLQSLIQINDNGSKNDLLEKGETMERIISWTCDDVDTTDFKNMPDYFSVSGSGRKMSLNWELKGKEAKHWWRKEERGAAGVRAGLFELVRREEIGRLFPRGLK